MDAADPFDADETSEVCVFPNPAKDELNITFPKEIANSANLKLFDLSGKMVPFTEFRLPGLEMAILILTLGVCLSIANHKR